MIPLTSKHTTELRALSASDRLRSALEDLIEENHQLRAVIAAMQAPKPEFVRFDTKERQASIAQIQGADSTMGGIDPLDGL